MFNASNWHSSVRSVDQILSLYLTSSNPVFLNKVADDGSSRNVRSWLDAMPKGPFHQERVKECMGRIIVLGAGGHAKVVISTLRSMGHSVIAVFDDAEHLKGSEVMGIPVLGATREAVSCEYDGAIIAVGNARVRKKIADSLPLKWTVAIHPRATVDDSGRIGAGTVVFAGAVIQPDVEIGEHSIVNTSANLDHDCWIGNFVHLAPGTCLAGQVAVGEGTMIGLGDRLRRLLGRPAESADIAVRLDEV